MITVRDNIIIKMFKEKDWDYNNILKYFPLDDSVFPKIYNIDDSKNKITMEYLNTIKAEKEFNKINNFLKKEYKTSIVKLYNSHKLQHNDIVVPDNLNDIYLKFKFILNKIKNIINDDSFLLDIHSKNFGYTISGDLKMFDI